MVNQMAPSSISLRPAAAVAARPCQERGTSARGRKRFFGSVLEALHGARRSQAEREINRYQYLVREAREYDARRKPKCQRSKYGEGAMTANLSPDSSSTDHLPKPQSSMSFKLRVLMATALFGFGILHLIGGAMMQRASSKPPIEAATLMPRGD